MKNRYELVPVIIPAGECVTVGGVEIRLLESANGEAIYRSLSLSDRASRTLVVPNPAHVPANWKTYRVLGKSRSSDSLSASNISSADSSDEMKNSPSSSSDAQKSKPSDNMSAFESWLRQHHLVLHGQLGRLEDRLLWLIRNDTGFALLCSDSWPPASLQIPLPEGAGELDASTHGEGCSAPKKSDSERVADCGATPCSPSSFEGMVRVIVNQVVSKETGEVLSRHMELRDAKMAAGARIERGEPRPTVRTLFEWIRKDQLASLYP